MAKGRNSNTGVAGTKRTTKQYELRALWVVFSIISYAILIVTGILGIVVPVFSVITKSGIIAELSSFPRNITSGNLAMWFEEKYGSLFVAILCGSSTLHLALVFTIFVMSHRHLRRETANDVIKYLVIMYVILMVTVNVIWNIVSPPFSKKTHLLDWSKSERLLYAYRSSPNDLNRSNVELEWDELQSQLLCCGLFSDDDYRQASNFSFDYIQPSGIPVRANIPPTCCKVEFGFTSEFSSCLFLNESIHRLREGCLPKLLNSFNTPIFCYLLWLLGPCSLLIILAAIAHNRVYQERIQPPILPIRMQDDDNVDVATVATTLAKLDSSDTMRSNQTNWTVSSDFKYTPRGIRSKSAKKLF